MDIQNKGFLSIEQQTQKYLGRNLNIPQTDGRMGESRISFREVLEQRALQGAGELKFSKHAAGRLADRNIELSAGQLERLSAGARKAGQKGIRDSLVIVDELAFIVNVPNNTVVTAMDSTATEDNVFTNINGAVIM